MLNRALLAALAAGVSCVVAGCVAAPDEVPPTFVDQRAYLSHSCEELRKLQTEGTAAVATLSEKQTSARRRSIAYNWLLVVGSGALTQDRSEALGRAKGELLAIEGCTTAGLFGGRRQRVGIPWSGSGNGCSA